MLRRNHFQKPAIFKLEQSLLLLSSSMHTTTAQSNSACHNEYNLHASNSPFRIKVSPSFCPNSVCPHTTIAYRQGRVSPFSRIIVFCKGRGATLVFFARVCPLLIGLPGNFSLVSYLTDHKLDSAEEQGEVGKVTDWLEFRPFFSGSFSLDGR